MKPIGEILGARAIHCLPEAATVLAAVREMSQQRVGAVLVVDTDGNLAGIFTERDLMTRVVLLGRPPESVRLAEVMTRELYTASPEELVSHVARELQERHIRHVPVVEGGRVIGVLSLRDLLRMLLAVREEELVRLTHYIQGDELA